MTKMEALITALTQHGYKEVPSASQRYRVFYRADSIGQSMWVGNNGTLRRGETFETAEPLTNTKRYRDLLKQGGYA